MLIVKMVGRAVARTPAATSPARRRRRGRLTSALALRDVGVEMVDMVIPLGILWVTLTVPDLVSRMHRRNVLTVSRQSAGAVETLRLVG